MSEALLKISVNEDTLTITINPILNKTGLSKSKIAAVQFNSELPYLINYSGKKDFLPPPHHDKFNHLFVQIKILLFFLQVHFLLWVIPSWTT